MRKFLLFIFREADKRIRSASPQKKILLLFGTILMLFYGVASITGDRDKVMQFREDKISDFRLPFPGTNEDIKKAVETATDTIPSDTTAH